MGLAAVCLASYESFASLVAHLDRAGCTPRSNSESGDDGGDDVDVVGLRRP